MRGTSTRPMRSTTSPATRSSTTCRSAPFRWSAGHHDEGQERRHLRSRRSLAGHGRRGGRSAGPRRLDRRQWRAQAGRQYGQHGVQRAPARGLCQPVHGPRGGRPDLDGHSRGRGPRQQAPEISRRPATWSRWASPGSASSATPWSTGRPGADARSGKPRALRSLRCSARPVTSRRRSGIAAFDGRLVSVRAGDGDRRGSRTLHFRTCSTTSHRGTATATRIPISECKVIGAPSCRPGRLPLRRSDRPRPLRQETCHSRFDRQFRNLADIRTPSGGNAARAGGRSRPCARTLRGDALRPW